MRTALNIYDASSWYDRHGTPAQDIDCALTLLRNQQSLPDDATFCLYVPRPIYTLIPPRLANTLPTPLICSELVPATQAWLVKDGLVWVVMDVG